jgi:phenylacetic acid degradation operon negative regulatory protein
MRTSLQFRDDRSKSVMPRAGCQTAAVVDHALTDTRPLSVRSVLLSTLLGTQPPRMPVSLLVRVGQLFGFTEGAVRTSLTRMVQRGELTSSDSRYELAGALVARQRRQTESRSAERGAWSGRWSLAVVTAEGRSAVERSHLREAMAYLRLAPQREGVWARPDNLPHDRAPEHREVVDAQCAWWFGHPGIDDAELASTLWPLDGWAAHATDLRRAMAPLTGRLEDDDESALAEGFVVSAAVLRHFQGDPLLPDELLPRGWPGRRLRQDYDRFDAAYRAVLARWLRVAADGG